MLNGYGNENGIKINRSNQQKKQKTKTRQICTCSTLLIFLISKTICTWLFLSFFAVVLNDYNALFIFMEELSYMLTKGFVSCVHVHLYFVTAAHFHLAGRYHFSFSHHRYEIFMFILHRNSSPSFLITRSSSFSVIHVSET